MTQPAPLYRQLLERVAKRGPSDGLAASQARAATFERYAKEAARRFNVKATDEIATRFACLRLCEEMFQARLISGKEVDASAATLKWLSEELAKFQRYGPGPLEHTLSIQIVGKDLKPISDLPVRPPPPSPPPSPSGSRNGEPLALPAPPAGPLSPAEASAQVDRLKAQLREAQEAVRQAEAIEREAIQRACAPPLQVSQPWAAFVDPIAGNPFRAGPMPDYGRGHPLPTPDFNK
jgi:hypothetical protein